MSEKLAFYRGEIKMFYCRYIRDNDSGVLLKRNINMDGTFSRFFVQMIELTNKIIILIRYSVMTKSHRVLLLFLSL